ncbi:hypothetical protein BCR35DRAFT_332729 [Leucosporidium creatinivorum]|uniref:Uncharacterized protein n=1 Tax=Leucosporidium creatinivorum TaxID=106004 RepID=A0A1Y2EZC1_9BASI|nr:hypothetical protein BCR35DRAFT_332729 [Leucosporidium creatinivorum]
MEAALERSSFATKHFGELVPGSPPWSNQLAITYVLTTMHQFTQLWFSPTSAFDQSHFLSIRAPLSPLFRDRRERVKQDVERAQYINKRWQERNDGEGLSLASLEGLQHEVQGKANWVIDQAHPFAELLEMPECKAALEEAVQKVYRRLMRAPNLADSHLKACAIVWKG